MKPIKDGCDAARAEMLESIMSECTDLGRSNTCHTNIADYTPQDMDGEFGHDEWL